MHDKPLEWKLFMGEGIELDPSTIVSSEALWEPRADPEIPKFHLGTGLIGADPAGGYPKHHRKHVAPKGDNLFLQ